MATDYVVGTSFTRNGWSYQNGTITVYGQPTLTWDNHRKEPVMETFDPKKPFFCLGSSGSRYYYATKEEAIEACQKAITGGDKTTWYIFKAVCSVEPEPVKTHVKDLK